jgi:prepilin-type N-terminal cleavage/methylation domain-containing protein
MKSEFKAKLLQHLTQKKQDKGFTLIELLVVIIIIGILSAIALPSFLNQANKAKESESKQYIGSINRTQQAYYLEKNRFSSDISLLGVGIRTQTTNYKYTISGASNTGVTQFSTAIDSTGAVNTVNLRVHTGGVKVGLTAAAGSGEATTLAILCQSARPAAGTAGGVNLGTGGDSNPPSCNTPSFESLEN